jgi:DNA adenine methylase
MKPFLKWAGNKYQIIDRIHLGLAPGKRLIEPFVGSAAIFLNTGYEAYLLSDTNPDLIKLYQHLKTEGAFFIEYCRNFFSPQNNEATVFYALRSEFNQTTDSRLKSALFLYLNKHCFNGLCRYNQKFEFNTPFGRYKKPYFPEQEMLFFHKKSQTADFQCADFLSTMQTANAGDIVYCDPPYVPLSKTANFTHYSAGGFTEVQQLLLAKTAEALAAKGVTVVISNHDTKFTQKAYQKAKLLKFDVQRFIGAHGSTRKKAAEILAIFN